MRKKFTYQQLKKIYFHQVNELIEIVKILMKDLSRIIEKSNEIIYLHKQISERIFLEEQGIWFRSANRITITTVEAICYKMKQLTLLLFKVSGKNLSPNDEEKLLEKKAMGLLFI